MVRYVVESNGLTSWKSLFKHAMRIIEALEPIFNLLPYYNRQVVTPTGTTLVENLSLRIEPGSNLLITGIYLVKVGL